MDIELKFGVALAHEATRLSASLHAMTLGSLGLGAVVAAAPVPVLAAVARSVEIHPAASVPAQHETKSGPPIDAQEEQKLGVHAFEVLVSC